MRAVLLTLALLLVTGCVTGNPPAANPQVANPAATRAPFSFSSAVLDMRIDPKDAAEFILNPTPLGEDGYPQGMVVTIEVLPQEGWRVDDWAGPVFDVAGNVAKITMGSSHTVVASMKRTTPPPSTKTGTSTEGSASSFNKGIELFEAENWSMAIDQFTLALQVNPQLKYAHYFRGNAYNHLEQYQRAVQDYDKEIELYPNDATSYVVRAAAYYNLGQYALSDADEAMACSLDSDWC